MLDEQWLEERFTEVALQYPLVHQALTRYHRGDITQQEALILLVLTTLEQEKRMRDYALELLNTCTCRTKYIVPQNVQQAT